MALSNWDTLAVNHTGKTSSGDFIAPNEVSVSLYKNWLYLRDANAWRKGDPYTGKTVGEIRSGDMDYRGIEVRAKRGPQDGVYAVVTHGYGDDIIGMAGCGVSGYVDPPAPCQCNSSIRSYHGDNLDEPMLAHCGECGIVVPDSVWVGVSKECVEFLKTFLDELHEDSGREISIFKTMGESLGKAKRFNQGDQFLGAAFGIENVQTLPGESEEPILNQMFRT